VLPSIVTAVKAKTEELLYLLLWRCDLFFRPTFRNLTDSFEEWAYRNGFHRQLAVLERRQLIESRTLASDDRVHRLTPLGRLLALGGRDPAVCWARRWDGRWRLVVFDVPLGQDAKRRQLVRYLHAKHFGYLQQSVWVTPDLLRAEHEILADSRANVESLILLEARPCTGETDQEIVRGAWDFEQINSGYGKYLELLNTRPGRTPADQTAAMAWRRWAAEERAAWLAAVSNDPLLPERLLPADYLGRRAWHRRAVVFDQAAGQLPGVRGANRV
jgi:phenylacetic acid degradation operon negative regulatory protein